MGLAETGNGVGGWVDKLNYKYILFCRKLHFET